MSLPVPMVRIEIDRMKQSILHAFSQMQLGQDEDFRAAVDAAVGSFDFAAVINEVALQELRKAIENAVRQAVWESLRDERLRAAVVEIVTKRLGGALCG